MENDLVLRKDVLAAALKGLRNFSGMHWTREAIEYIPKVVCGVRSELDAVPSVDAVEVVRCKDCKHRYHNPHYGANCCEAWGDGFDTFVQDDEFCSRGRSKQNGEEY